MKKLSIASLVAVSLTAGAAFAADSTQPAPSYQNEVTPDVTTGLSTRRNVTSDEAAPDGGVKSRAKTLSRSEQRALKKGTAPANRKEGVVARHIDQGDQLHKNISPEVEETRNSASGNPGAQ